MLTSGRKIKMPAAGDLPGGDVRRRPLTSCELRGILSPPPSTASPSPYRHFQELWTLME